MAQTVTDRAIQVHGGIGLSKDFPVASAFINARYVRLTDGPDEVHLAQLGKLKIAQLSALPVR